MQDLICICKQKTFSPVSSTNSSQTEKVLPVKTSKPTFITFVYFGNSLFDIICEISLFVTTANQETIARNLCKFGVTHSEEMEVNQWIHWISRLWVAIIRAHEKHYPLFKHILKWSAVSHKILIESWLLGI